MKRLPLTFAGVLVAALLVGCSASSGSPIQLSTSQPSLLFFYTEG